MGEAIYMDLIEHIITSSFRYIEKIGRPSLDGYGQNSRSQFSNVAKLT